MSFFQLTSLGPENYIQSTLINCGCKSKIYNINIKAILYIQLKNIIRDIKK